MQEKKGFNTKAVSEGELKDKRFGNVTTPIFETATFLYPNFTPDRYSDEKTNDSFIYSRWGNPTVNALEKKYASLEDVKHGLSFSTGMAAITSLLLSMGKMEKRALSIFDLYGQTLSFFKNKYTAMTGNKIDIISVDQMNSGDFNPSEYSMIYLESITNPSMKVLDLVELGKICRENHITLITDATFASPYNQNPAKLGSDFVVHSGTKYLNGHSDTMSGFIGTDHDLMKTFDMRKNLGGSLDAFQAFLIQRGLKTLGLRMERHNKNTLQIAEFLKEHSKVIDVMYPGLTDNKYHSIGKKNLRGFGGMLSFRVKGGLEGARKFLFSLEYIAPAPSLGGVESLATLPVDTSHASASMEDRKSIGVTEDMVRFSTGIEDPEDLIEDIGKALSQIS